MDLNKAGALALILGTITMIGVMALHPSGAAGHGDALAKTLRLGVIVHAVAIAMAPVLTFGFFAFTRSVGFERALPGLAFFVFLFGAVCVMMAATMSGFVAPRLIEALSMAQGAERDLLHGLLRLEWYLNQSFATLHVALFSGAIMLWALSWPDKGVLGAAIQIAGLVVSIGVLAWLISGTLELNVHGMGAVVLAQGAWTILAGVGLAMRVKT